jgi:hypothetical protein
MNSESCDNLVYARKHFRFGCPLGVALVVRAIPLEKGK